MHSLTERQQAFISIAEQYVVSLLQAHFRLDKKTPAEIDALSSTSFAVTGLQASILLAGALTSAPTLGGGLVGAVSIVVLAQAGKAFSDWFKKYSENNQESDYPDEVKRDIRMLRMQVQLLRAIHLTAIRYAYILEKIVDEKGVTQFAHETTERFMKQMRQAQGISLDNIPEAENLVDYLLTSVNLSIKRKIPRISLQNSTYYLTNRIPVKFLWARPQWYGYEAEGFGEFMGSRREHQFIKTTTMAECGFIALPKSKLQLPSLALNRDSFQPIATANLPEEPTSLIKKLCFEYPVKRADVEGYLLKVRSKAPLLPHSLNHYLSQLLDRPVIAVCHDSELQGLDMRGGRFSSVDFTGADLSSCDLRDTNWSGQYTLLMMTKFNDVLLNEHTNFQFVHAELSRWVNVHFHIGFKIIHAKFNGAALIDCTVPSGFLLQPGTDWLLATFRNLTIEDPTTSLAAEFQSKLNQEWQARFELQAEIKQITETCEAKIRASMDEIQDLNTLNHEAISQELKSHLKSMEEKYGQWTYQVNEQLKQIYEKLQILETIYQQSIHAITTRQYLQRQEDDERWSEQRYSDSIRDHRLASLEARQSIINRLWHYFSETINTTSYQLIKSSYVELVATNSLILKDATKLPLIECMDNHVESGQDILIIQGEDGCGRTTALKLYFEELLIQFMKQFSRESSQADIPATMALIPIIIDIHPIQDTSRNVLRTGLELILDKVQVDSLIEKNRCLIMIDNIGTNHISIQKLLQDCTFLSKKFSVKPKFIFSIKTSYLLSLERGYHGLFTGNQLKLSPECIVQPLDKRQIMRFFSFFHAEEVCDQLLSLQTKSQSLSAMLGSPLMLNIIANAMLSASFHDDQLIFRSDFYESSWRALHEHVQSLLHPEHQRYQDFIFIVQELAIDLFEHEAEWIEKPFEKKHHSEVRHDPLSYLFSAKLKYLFFLSITKKDDMLHVRFMHPSLGHYWVAQKLFRILLDTELPIHRSDLQLWNIHFLRKYPDILNFLVEFIQKSGEQDRLLDRLMSIVLLTKESRYHHLEIAASNAITVRCRLNKNFAEMPLEKIRIPHADLTEGIFVGTHFRQADLSHVRFVRATWLWTDVRDADLTGVQFLNATSFIQTDGPLKTFAVYPTSSEIIIAYVVAPEGRFQRYKIALIQVAEGKATKLQLWSAHQQMIQTMAWGVHEGVARLASAGLGGTIRIWVFNNSEPAKELAKLCEYGNKSAISTLSWGPHARYIAAGGEDRYVHIWDVNKKIKIYQSPLFQSSPIRALLWDKETDRLIAVDDSNILHLWQNPEQTASIDRLTRMTFSSPFLHETTPIRSIALSRMKQIALGQESGVIVVMQMDESALTQPLVLHGHKRKINSLCWMGSMLISASDDQTVRIWRNNFRVTILQHDHPVGRVELLPNGYELISGVDSLSPRIYFWNINESSEERATYDDPLGAIICLAIHLEPIQQQTFIAVGYISGVVMLYVTTMQANNLSQKILWTHENASVSQLTWSIDGSFLASLCQDGSVVIRNIRLNNQPLIILRGTLNAWFTHLSWLNDSKHPNLFLISGSDGSINIYNATNVLGSATLSPIMNIRTANGESIHCMAIAPNQLDTTTLSFVCSVHDRIEVWSVMFDAIPSNSHASSSSCIASQAIPISSPFFESDLENPLRESNSKLLSRSSRMSKKIYEFNHPEGIASTLVWSPNGLYLASADQVRTIYIWSDSYTCLYFYSHSSDIRCLIWSETWLIVGTMKEMLVWDTNGPISSSLMPKNIPVAAPILGEAGSHLVIAENKGIWACHRNRLFRNPGASSWVMQIKPDFLAHQANAVGARTTASINAFLRQKGALISHQSSFFSTHPSNAQYRLPAPSRPEELRALYRQDSIMHNSFTNIDDQSSESTASTGPNHTRVRAGSEEASELNVQF